MPIFEALYYPNFEPNTQWLRSFLLFFDKIRSIVPADVEFKLSDEISKLLDLIPDSFETISPKEKDIVLDKINLDRMRKAFEIIKGKESKIKHKKLTITIDEEGKIQIAGHAFIHNRKLSKNLCALLRAFDLIEEELMHEFNKGGIKFGDFSIIKEEAADLIMSQIADRISRRYGWNTITDRGIDFIVTALNDFSYKSLEEPNTMLLCSIINCEIPHEIRYINPEKYKIIRNAYSDIREPFHNVVSELSNLYKLGIIEDKVTLKEKITEITREFDSEVEKFKKTNFGRKVKRWMPIGVGGLATIISGAFAQPTVTITCAAVSVLIQIVQELTEIKEPHPEQIKVKRLIGNMQKDILKASEIKRLI